MSTWIWNAGGLKDTLTIYVTVISTSYRIMRCQHCPTTLRYLDWCEVVWRCCTFVVNGRNPHSIPTILSSWRLAIRRFDVVNRASAVVELTIIWLAVAVCMCVGLFLWACYCLQFCQWCGEIHPLVQWSSLLSTPVRLHTAPMKLHKSLNEDSIQNVFVVGMWTPACIQPKLIDKLEWGHVRRLDKPSYTAICLCNNIFCVVCLQQKIHYTTVRFQYFLFDTIIQRFQFCHKRADKVSSADFLMKLKDSHMAVPSCIRLLSHAKRKHE